MGDDSLYDTAANLEHKVLVRNRGSNSEAMQHTCKLEHPLLRFSERERDQCGRREEKEQDRKQDTQTEHEKPDALRIITRSNYTKSTPKQRISYRVGALNELRSVVEVE